MRDVEIGRKRRVVDLVEAGACRARREVAAVEEDAGRSDHDLLPFVGRERGGVEVDRARVGRACRERAAVRGGGDALLIDGEARASRLTGERGCEGDERARDSGGSTTEALYRYLPHLRECT